MKPKPNPPQNYIIDDDEQFCPHLDLRVSQEYFQILQFPECSSASTSTSSIPLEESPSRLCPSIVSLNGDTSLTCDSSSIVSEGSGSICTIESKKKRIPKVCSSCKISSSPSDQSQTGKSSGQFWKCLDSKCGLVLCGSSGDNHAREHSEEYPEHGVQENISTHRIWCGHCEREIFKDRRNRRKSPGIFVPPIECDFTHDPPRGLCNIGNTCFMNAALQNIVAVAPLTSYLLGDCCSIVGKHVAGSYRWLLSELVSEPQRTYRNGVIPSRLLHAVRGSHPIFRGFQQHDAQEFLRLFMDSLANDTKVPHFIIQEDEPTKKEDSENESDTESYETCDSGNGSEETALNGEGDGGFGDNEMTEDRKVEKSSVKVVMKSFLSDIFDGQIESSVQCLSCHQTSRRIEVFQDLSLPIPSRDELTTLKSVIGEVVESGWISWFWGWVKSFLWGPLPALDDCFKAFFSSDELKGKNMYFCEKCGKLRNGIKRCSLFRLPEVLCIHLKRFRMYEYTGGMGYSGKISQFVQFPIDGLDVRPFLHPDSSPDVSEYRLMGVICHMGSVLGGHYVAYIRKGDQWFLADDSCITSASWDAVAESEAYVLFYQKYIDEEDVTKRKILRAWGDVDACRVHQSQFHIVSRKWLTRFFSFEENPPLDNSDVVCPHGFLVPGDDLNLRGTWMPHNVWEMIISKYGGGPDWKYPGDCSICTPVWKKFLKAALKPTNNTTRKQSISEAVHAAFNSAGAEPNLVKSSSANHVSEDVYQKLSSKITKSNQTF